MEKIIVHTGFPHSAREYAGENIIPVSYQDFAQGINWFRLENGNWIREIAPECYITDWNDEERWGRVEIQHFNDEGKLLSSEEAGFMILLADRSRGLF